jgi:hypothetical protein
MKRLEDMDPGCVWYGGAAAVLVIAFVISLIVAAVRAWFL